MAEENLPVAFTLTHCSSQGIIASHLVCALLISFSFLVLPFDPTLYFLCVCVLMRIRPVPLRSSLLTHTASFSPTFPSISAPLVHTRTTLSALSSLSPHLLSHRLKCGGGAGRTRISGPPRSARPRAALGAAADRPKPSAKLPCWTSRCCCCRRASKGWSRASVAAARSSPSPCTCLTCPPSWMTTVTSHFPTCQKCASSPSVRRTSCPLSHRHSSPASSSSSSSCCPPRSPSPTPSPSPSPWRCASATWSPRQPP